jgi:kojibiose phosphorylase
MGPDEYTPISHNNSYTNRMAALNLSLAAKHGKEGGASDKECAEFERATKLLPIPRISKTLVAQCEDFEKLADPQFDKLWKNRKKAFAAQVSQERLYRTRCSKQADVLMLMVLFPNEFTKDELKAAWDYYVPYCTHDSSLSPGAHALTALKLGLFNEAWKFWENTGGLDLDIDHGGAEQGIHIANCGSTWMVAVNGFGGLKSAMDTDTLTLNPILPEKWKRLSFPIVWKGTNVKIDITKDSVTITNIDKNPITAEVWGKLQEIGPKSFFRFQMN